MSGVVWGVYNILMKPPQKFWILFRHFLHMVYAMHCLPRNQCNATGWFYFVTPPPMETCKKVKANRKKAKDTRTQGCRRTVIG